MLKLIALLVLSALASAQLEGYEKKIACENSLLRIDCPVDSIIVIQSAVYGRNAAGSVVCPNSSIRTTSCAATTSFDKVNAACNGKQTCSIASSNSVFGDPCSGTYKYLEVYYFCKSTKIVETTTPKPETTTPEPETTIQEFTTVAIETTEAPTEPETTIEEFTTVAIEFTEVSTEPPSTEITTDVPTEPETTIEEFTTVPIEFSEVSTEPPSTEITTEVPTEPETTIEEFTTVAIEFTEVSTEPPSTEINTEEPTTFEFETTEFTTQEPNTEATTVESTTRTKITTTVPSTTKSVKYSFKVTVVADKSFLNEPSTLRDTYTVGITAQNAKSVKGEIGIKNANRVSGNVFRIFATVGEIISFEISETDELLFKTWKVGDIKFLNEATNVEYTCHRATTRSYTCKYKGSSKEVLRSKEALGSKEI